MPTWKSLPNSVKPKRYGPPSCFTDFVHEILSYGIRNLIHTKTELITSGALWIKRIRYPFYPMNTTYLWKDADWFERCVGRYLPGLSAQPSPLW